MRDLGVWCQENNLSLNVNKTKEMIMDFGKQQREHPPYPHRRESSREGGKLSSSVYHEQTEMVKCGEEQVPLQRQEAEEMWLVN